ncbi:glutathione S-transferase [Rhodothalassium salexigens DSM 2132]|uniref:Glutathione S-transferase n=1 Tax=Rhodothalassium salexigens DSM 2132 TaxID=1188247 RepID=A0A4R2PI81_RHOSA|nr:glutathione S-transferase family protein [Rhodothalassium salexigens]MBB4211821.1 glutathione S-transferase [Rhodothalassium salexigens DSM 2132]MBK1638156.1 hypothetical protein [Rhodothalassium salexigens DSM 2132]TCP33881.1 glutathione S-transferase [Rhodothalassium salexigens DSM 2132]
MKLFGAHLSPYFERVWLQLHLKGQTDAVDYPGVPGNALRSPEHLAHNPIGRIPYLELAEGEFLPEAQVIVEHFERLFPEPALRPADPPHAARVDLICRVLDLYVLPDMILVARLASQPDPDRAALGDKLRSIQSGIGYLEHFFAAQDWAVGDEPTLADCALIPFLFFAGLIQKSGGMDILADAPKLGAYRALIADSDLARTGFDNMARSLDQVRAAEAKARGQG